MTRHIFQYFSQNTGLIALCPRKETGQDQPMPLFTASNLYADIKETPATF